MSQIEYEIVDVASIPGKRKRSKWEDAVDGFLASGEKACRADWEGNYKSVYTALTVLRKYIDGRNLPIETMSRQGRIYMVRSDAE